MKKKDGKAFWPIIFAIFFGNFLAVMNTSTVNVAVPALMMEFSAELSAAQWTITGFMLAAGAAAPSAGWFGTRFGYKKVYISVLCGFFVFSVLCIFAPTMESLIFFRMMQGICSGILMPSTMTLVYQTIEKSRQAYGLSLWSLSAGLAPAVGPVLAGFLIDMFDWQAMFYLNLPIAGAAIVAALKFLPDTAAGAKIPFDFPGFLFSFIGSMLLLLTFSEGGSWGWLHSKTWMTAGLAMVFLALFVRRELKVEFPLLNFSVLSHRKFMYSLLLKSVLSTGLYVGAFLILIFLQTGLQLGAFEAGLIMMPSALMMVLFTPVSGKLYHKTGPVPLIAAGIFLMIVGTYMMGGLSIESTTLSIIIWTSVRYIGIALCNMPITNAGMSAVPREIAGYASAMNNWVRQCSASLSIALFSTLLASQISVHAQKGNSIQAAASFAVGDAFLYSLIPLVMALLLSILLQKDKRSGMEKIMKEQSFKVKGRNRSRSI
ncbi:EmrB/QacA subfamily drug resistance transporter [Bacillus fengqiuensis]|nr:EmrB/QacA subfamily drug resistance transporter [Bacillus fengqiuensis]